MATGSVAAPAMPPLAADGIGGLGVLRALRRNAYSAFPAACFDHPVLKLHAFGRPLVSVNAPGPIRHVLQTHADDYGRLAVGRRLLSPIVGRGLLVSEGDAWRRQRRAMAPAFTPRTVSLLAAHIMHCTETAMTALAAAADRPVDLLAATQRLSLEIASVTMFSLTAETFGDELRAMVSRYMTTIGRPTPSDFLLPERIPTIQGTRRALFRRRWRRLIAAIIAARGNGPPADPPRDLFDLMQSAHGTSDPELLADEVATMIVAGHETTALTLFWACVLLSRAPDWQRAVAAEARGADLSPDGAAAALPQLRLARAVVQEALRLYPPAFMTVRLALRDHVIDGVDVPAGSMVLIPFWVLHRNKQWWSAPERFDPARFLDEADPDRFTFLPFGLGPHVCIGAQLALTEAILVIARLCRDFEVVRLSDRPVWPVGVLSTRPDHSPAFSIRPTSQSMQGS